VRASAEIGANRSLLAESAREADSASTQDALQAEGSPPAVERGLLKVTRLSTLPKSLAAPSFSTSMEYTSFCSSRC
jgi:hypothetical protein